MYGHAIRFIITAENTADTYKVLAGRALSVLEILTPVVHCITHFASTSLQLAQEYEKFHSHAGNSRLRRQVFVFG